MCVDINCLRKVCWITELPEKLSCAASLILSVSGHSFTNKYFAILIEYPCCYDYGSEEQCNSSWSIQR